MHRSANWSAARSMSGMARARVDGGGDDLSQLVVAALGTAFVKAYPSPACVSQMLITVRCAFSTSASVIFKASAMP